MNRKKYALLLLLVFLSTVASAQKTEKIKGSRSVTKELKEMGSFNAIEIEDNLEIYLERADKPSVTIEADDNLHEVIITEIIGKTLHIHTTKFISNYKKLIVRINYNTELNSISTKGETILNAIQPIQLDNLSIKTVDNSISYLNVNVKNFTLELDDKSKTELNLKSEKAKVVLSKDSNLKSLINTTELSCDLYQKAVAIIEGDAKNGIIRLDNNASLTANKLTIKNLDLTLESYTSCSVTAETSLVIDAHDKAEIQLYGNPKIEIRQFTNEAKLYKKEK